MGGSPPPFQFVDHETALGALESLCEILCGPRDSLYVILDAARDPRILPLLRLSNEEHSCVYQDPPDDLIRVAPYLAPARSDSKLLRDLLRYGWGNSWGVFLASPQPMAEVRKHLRHFLMVDTERGKQYFRFYDPRVLRHYLPTCNPAETREFFGPLSSYLMEDEDPEVVLRFVPHAAGVRREPVRWIGESGGRF